MDPLRLCGINIETHQLAGTVDCATAAKLLREVTAWCRALLALWQECAPRDSFLRSLFSEREAEKMRLELDRLAHDDAGYERVLAFFHTLRLQDVDEGTINCFTHARDILQFALAVHSEAQRSGVAHVGAC